MTTNKELAAAYMLVAQDFYSHDQSTKARAGEFTKYLREIAGELLDPPKPTYPDGTIAWIYDDSWRYLAVRCDRKWRIGDNTGAASVMSDDDVTKVEPLRVLADDEIALPRAAFDITDGLPRDAERARYYAASLEASGYSVGPGVFRAYADALDAEAGEQS